MYGLSGRLLDWEFGDRDGRTVKRLIDRLKAWNPLFYCTDDCVGFPKLLPPERHHAGKDGTVAIEQNNGRQRHYLARFKCKSIVVSKSKDMVDLSIQLFAAVHVNKSFAF